jgi:hypothetical protein
MEEMLIEKVRQRTILYDTKSTDYRDQHMRANAWEGIGQELKIKRKFYVSSRDVRSVCPASQSPVPPRKTLSVQTSRSDIPRSSTSDGIQCQGLQKRRKRTPSCESSRHRTRGISCNDILQQFRQESEESKGKNIAGQQGNTRVS